MCGVADLFLLSRDSHYFEKHYNDKMIGKLPDYAHLYKERSPLTLAHQISVPLLLFQGEKDTVVVPENSYEMQKRMKKDLVTLHTYPNENHMLAAPSTLKDMMQKMEAFFNKNVLGMAC